MTIPTKAALTDALDRFAHELRSLAKSYGKTEARGVEQVNGIADIADGASKSIAETDRPYVHPVTAQTLAGLAERIEEIADTTTDQMYATSLRIAATALMTFVWQQTPLVTPDGLRFSD